MRYRRLYDISVRVAPDLPTYPGDPLTVVRQETSTAGGDAVNLSALAFGSHAGTHVDAPYHLDATWPSLDEVDLGVFLGPALVVELGTDSITAADLRSLAWRGVERVLFKTRNSALWGRAYTAGYVALSEDGAAFLAERTSVRLVGIDYLSVDAADAASLPAHRRLLARGIVILEGLDLSGVPAGKYTLLCLPLRAAAPDGAPARAVLLET